MAPVDFVVTPILAGMPVVSLTAGVTMATRASSYCGSGFEGALGVPLTER